MFKKQISFTRLNFWKRNLGGPKTVSLIFCILVICFVIGFYIFAWTEPTTSPPGGNVAAPLNTSISPQTKAGDLTIVNLNAAAFYDSVSPNYFIDPDAAVGNPSVKVKGYIQAEGGYKSSDGTIGLTKTIQVMQSGYGLCTMTFKNGLLTATTCPTQ